MICTDVRGHLDALLDGTLSLPARRRIDTHLAGCAACRAELEAVRTLRADARRLPGSIQPPSDLWPAIDRRLDPDAGVPLSRARPGRLRRRVALGAAAVLIAVASSVVTLWVTADRDRPRAAALIDTGTLLPIEVDYARAAEDLEQVLAVRRDALSPATVEVLERNLRVIDQAIAEARAALENDPANRLLTERLLGVHAMKLDLLQRAVKL